MARQDQFESRRLLPDAWYALLHKACHALYFKRLHRDLDSMHCLGIAREASSSGAARNAAGHSNPAMSRILGKSICDRDHACTSGGESVPRGW
jgi:hypothetical protein